VISCRIPKEIRWLAGLFLNCSAYWRNLLSFGGVDEAFAAVAVAVVEVVEGVEEEEEECRVRGMICLEANRGVDECRLVAASPSL